MKENMKMRNHINYLNLHGAYFALYPFTYSTWFFNNYYKKTAGVSKFRKINIKSFVPEIVKCSKR